jgi:hypothetical protein
MNRVFALFYFYAAIWRHEWERFFAILSSNIAGARRMELAHGLPGNHLIHPGQFLCPGYLTLYIRRMYEN